MIARGKSVAARSWSCSKPSHTALTTRLRPTSDRFFFCNRGQIEERTYDWSQKSYDWSQRSWVIARGKSVATRSMVMFKTWNLLFQIVSGRTISRATGRATLRPVGPTIVPIDCSRRIPRLIIRSIVEGHDWSYDRSFMATTSRTISYDMMGLVELLQSVLIARPRVRPIVRWPTTSTKDRSPYATASGDRSKHCRSVAHSPNHNPSYDQAIVRSGVTVALRSTGIYLLFGYRYPVTYVVLVTKYCLNNTFLGKYFFSVFIVSSCAESPVSHATVRPMFLPDTYVSW